MGYARRHETQVGWEAEVARLTDTRHLAAWSDDPEEQVAFASRLGMFWQGQTGVEVVRLYGRDIHTIDDLCSQLERSIPGEEPLRRQIGGRQGISARLRSRPEFPGRPAAQYRYVLWHDADAVLEADRGLFTDVADAISGVAAECEFVCDDLLLIGRAVYVGGPRLAALALDETGPLQSWQHDGVAEPFWRVVSGIERPPVLAAPIERLLQDPESLATELLLADLNFEEAYGL